MNIADQNHAMSISEELISEFEVLGERLLELRKRWDGFSKNYWHLTSFEQRDRFLDAVKQFRGRLKEMS